MADIYNREQQHLAGIFTSDNAILTVAGGLNAVAGAMVQMVQWQYSQDYQEVYELGSGNVYRVLQRPKGRMTIQRIIGTMGTSDFASTLLNACGTGGTLMLTGTPSTCSGASKAMSYSFGGVQVVDLGGQVSVQDHMIRENIVLAFTSMSKV